MADRAGRPDAQQDRVAVAVVADLVDGERVAGRLALVPELLARAAPEPRLAGLARAAQRLLVHPGEHQHAAVVGVLDDRRASDPDRPSGLLQLALQLRQPLGPLVDDRGDQRRLGAGLERLGQVRGVAGAARGDHGHGDRVGDGTGQDQVVAGARAVGVDRGEQDLAGAALDRLLRPRDRVETARRSARRG